MKDPVVDLPHSVKDTKCDVQQESTPAPLTGRCKRHDTYNVSCNFCIKKANDEYYECCKQVGSVTDSESDATEDEHYRNRKLTRANIEKPSTGSVHLSWK